MLALIQREHERIYRRPAGSYLFCCKYSLSDVRFDLVVNKSESYRLQTRRRHWQERAAYGRKRRILYLAEKHRADLGLSNGERRVRKRTAKPGEVSVKAPSILCFVENPEEMSFFISELRECYFLRKPVFVILKGVSKVAFGGITVLLSVMVRFKARKIDFDGDFPTDANAKLMLRISGFFDHLYKKRFQDADAYDLKGKSSILTHAMKCVDAELGEEVIKAASQTVWNGCRRCPGVQRTLIELMQNTNNHASLEREGDKLWWLSIHHRKSERVVSFTFVDYGVGVFRNLENKRADSKFFGVLNTLLERVQHGDRCKILEMIFSGELHRTASGKPFRGKGLPGIYDAFINNKFSNFTMITNDVCFNSANKTYRLLKNEFHGTFVYWELRAENFNLPE